MAGDAAARADHQIWLDSLYAMRAAKKGGSRTSSGVAALPVAGEGHHLRTGGAQGVAFELPRASRSPPHFHPPPHPQPDLSVLPMTSSEFVSMQWFPEAEEEVVYRSAQLGGDMFVDDDEQVYRSLSSADESNLFQGGMSTDEPVYRSLGDLFASGGAFEVGTTGQVDDEDEDASAEWLQTMPPLVCRQRGRTTL